MINIGRVVGFVGIMIVFGGTTVGAPLYAAPTFDDNADLDAYPLAITPPQGWIVERNSSGMSLVIQRPVIKEKRKPGQIYYRPNITATVSRLPRYIDKQGAEEFLGELAEFYRQQRIAAYTIQDEVQFVDHNGPEKGFVAYSTANLGGIKVTQMHLVISGENRSAIITYSDLESRFGKNDAEFKMIWDAMLSSRLQGVQPHRYEQIIKYSVIGIIALILFSTIFSIRKTSMNRLLVHANAGDVELSEDEMGDEIDAVFAQVEIVEEDDISSVMTNDEVEFATDQPVTNPRQSIAR